MTMPKRITLAHGSGGKQTKELIENIFVKKFKNAFLDEMDDSASLSLDSKKIAYTTDSFVIDPPEFRGGDIGKLALCGSLNDLAVNGAKPLYVSAGVIVEEGLDISMLERIASSMAKEAISNKVKIVAGDFKVVPKGKCDKIFINTSAIGTSIKQLKAQQIKASDKILINGPVAQHGLSILLAREDFAFNGKIKSDCASLWPLIEKLLKAGIEVKFMRDPTRGGIAATLNEIVENKNYNFVMEEDSIPLDENCRVFAEILGLDVLDIANEGKALFFVAARHAQRALKIMRSHALGKQAAIIGTVEKKISYKKGKVYLNTAIGGMRIVDMPQDEPMPRIC